jgi:hypothetical protein
MKRHVDLVGLLYMLWGGMILLISVSLSATGVAAALIGDSASAAMAAGRLNASLVASIYFMLAALGFVFGLTHLWVGSRLRRFREWARAFAIVLSVVDLVCVPFGTGLGIYTLWALLKEQSKPLFEAPGA